ncbi:hypothetical protein MLD38_008438 [Melastoma candidum]|uniref:Uncharacterized protein n=1 Tax=Melastoma candidum TaxID=119954 RepID=A0ACB9RUI4_9MYRT|nr:hypothetical protein MLD38_008438 [Melastoma candidum]
MEAALRLRLVFEDADILTKSQRKQGLARCWILLKPNHRTFLDLSSYLVDSFGLRSACPKGILLLMGGFVLPPFESTSLLKNEDVICVRRKRGKVADFLKLGDQENCSREIVAVNDGCVGAGFGLLANEKFEKESGGYESEDGDVVTKKRKASKELQSSKIKKGKASDAEESCKISGGAVNHAIDKEGNQLPVLKRASCEVSRCSKAKDDPLNKLMGEIGQEVLTTGSMPTQNGKLSPSASAGPLETKKPSRSARRKKAKRRWLRELRNIGKTEESSPGQSNQTNKSHNDKDKDNNCSFTKDHLKLHHNQKSAEVLPLPVKENDESTNVVPIVIRPGHIRFEPLDEDGEQADGRTPPPMSFHWNGTTSKKKGQKWGTEKGGTVKWLKPGHSGQNLSQVSDIEEKISLNDSEDLSKLPQYTSFPKVGEIVAYRVIELSSSWCPELTSFRVGKMSSFDPKSNKVVLVPVHEHPLDLENIDRTLYGEDGTLEINFSSLIDVRDAKCGNTGSVQAISVQAEFPPGSVDTATACQANTNDKALLAPAQENGGGNSWDEISMALSARKAQLSQQDNWTEQKSSGNRAWSFKALRGSALGPTMALLRAQNGVLDS